jgi:hypothetical protein
MRAGSFCRAIQWITNKPADIAAPSSAKIAPMRAINATAWA